MNNNRKNEPALLSEDELMKVENNMTVDDYLAQLHADFDPVYSMLMNYQCAAEAVETKVNILNNRLSLQGEHNPIESIKSRVKSLDSIIHKLDKHGFPIEIESVEKLIDVAGVRIICSFVDDIYKIEECLLAQEDVKLIMRNDYIQNPKPSGYRSLHLVIETPIYTENGKKDMKVEIQLRTMAMDFWASLSHKLRYKKNLDPKIADELSAELEACAKVSAELDGKMLQIRDRISNNTTAASES